MCKNLGEAITGSHFVGSEWTLRRGAEISGGANQSVRKALFKR